MADVIAAPWARALDLFVPGKPQPAGSKRAFTNKKLGRTMVVDANPKAKPWQALVHDYVVAELEDATLPLIPEGAISLTLKFSVARPLGHYGTKGLRPSAPNRPTVRPDVLKLARAVEDALTGVLWRDDAQIVDEYLVKEYGDREGVAIHVRAW